MRKVIFSLSSINGDIRELMEFEDATTDVIVQIQLEFWLKRMVHAEWYNDPDSCEICGGSGIFECDCPGYCDQCNGSGYLKCDDCKEGSNG